MSDKKKFPLGKIINLFISLPSIYKISNLFFELVKHEVWLAKKNLMTLLILMLVMSSLLTSMYLCLLGLLLVYLVSLQLSWLMSLLIVLILNLLLLILVIFSILTIKKKISFWETRQLLHQFYKHN